MNLLGLLRLFNRGSSNLLNWSLDNFCCNNRLESSDGCLRLSGRSLLNLSLLSTRLIVLLGKLILQSLQLLSLLVDWRISEHLRSLLVKLDLLLGFNRNGLGTLFLLLGHISDCLLLRLTEEVVNAVNFSTDNVLSLLCRKRPLRLQSTTDAGAATTAIIVRLILMLRVKTANGGVVSVLEQFLTHELTFLFVQDFFNMIRLRPHVDLQLTAGLHGHDVLRLQKFISRVLNSLLLELGLLGLL